MTDMQTTPGDGSDFKGPLVHRPGRIEADQQTIADLKTTVRRLEREHPALVYALEKLDTQAQTIAHWKDETERWQEFANGYMRDLTAAEQTIAELRKALEEQ